MSSDPIATYATDRALHPVTGAQAGPGPDRLADLPPVIESLDAVQIAKPT